MFPILTTGGTVAGFGGRTLSGDSAKYLNTPETSIYKKGRILYGLYGSKEAIRNANVAYIVEGYTDYLSLFQAGVENVIASSGTAFTSEQAALISRFTRRVILVFDADQAGNKAMERSIPILLKKNLEVLLATLPKGDDPDSFVRRRGREGFLEVMSEAVDFLDYQISGLLNDFEKASPMEQARMLRPVLENIDNVGDKLAAGLYRKRLAGILGINEKVLEGFRRNRMHSKEFGTGGIERGSEKVTVTTRRVSFDPIETAVLEVLLSGKYSASRRLIEFIGKVDFTEGVFGKIFTRLSRSVSEGEVTDISWLMDNLPSYVASVLAEIAEKASGKTFEDDLLKDIATRIRERDAALRREVLIKKIRDAGDDISPDVLREYHELAKKTKVK
jgi:DNA primase